MRWLESGRIDMKRLNKYMPNTAQDLRTGDCDPDALAVNLVRLFPLQDGAEANMLPHAAQSLIQRVLPPYENTDLDVEEYDEIAAEMKEDLQQKICHYFRLLNVHGAREDEDRAVSKLKGIRFALDKLCRSWGNRLDGLFYHCESGLFLKECKVYRLSTEEFDKIVVDMSTEAYDKSLGPLKILRFEHKLKQAANGIARGFDREKETCWECEAVKSSMKICRGCEAAHFCDHECQEAAWKTWHKQCCPIIRMEFKLYQQSLVAVDAAHEHGCLFGGFQLRDAFDYNLAIGMTLMAPRPFVDEMCIKLNGPDMKFFYENLDRVVRGEWWLWHDAENLDLDGEKTHPVVVGGLLAYDFFRYADKCLGITDPSLITLSMFESKDFTIDGFLEEGALMSAKRFLHLYSSEGCLDEKKISLQARKASGLQAFREKHQRGASLCP